MYSRILFILSAMLLARIAHASDYVWWEAEQPRVGNFPKSSAFSPETFPDTRHLLSNGNWLSISGKRGEEIPFARYQLTIPRAGEYHFWVRKFWKHGPFRWRFGKQDWRISGRDVALADDAFLRKHVAANWVSLGKVNLDAGDMIFEFQLEDTRAGGEVVAAFDCFVLTPGPFIPNGSRKPDERIGKANEGFFPYEPAIDSFTNDALLDLRHLNEKIAGESGFVRREGDRFVLGDGKHVRFWAVNVGPNNIGQDRASIDYLARKLAKLGVNMVRCHGRIFEWNDAEKSKQQLDNVQHLVHALKQQGIYTHISFYFPLWYAIDGVSPIDGYDTIQNKKPFALLYFDPKFQQIYRSWLQQLLTTVSPYSGVPLAKEPAVAIVELVNEDSFFFWTFTKKNVPQQHWRTLESQFARWLIKRHGSIDQAYDTWNDERLREDDPDAGRMGIYEAWHMTRDGLKQGGAGKTKRVGDQVRFLAETQRGFYESTTKYVKDEIGYGGLVSASNWHVSDASLLDAIERYTYTATDVIDHHGYFNAEHKGDGAGYSVRAGHSFASRSALLHPDKLPIRVHQVMGFPQIISEIGWTNPNRYRADNTLVCSAYGARQGIDGLFFFMVGSNYLSDSTMNKFQVSSPLVAGSFPATALMYRRGDVREGDIAKLTEVDLDEVFAMKGTDDGAAASLDAFRETAETARGQQSSFNPLLFYCGKIMRSFENRGAARELPRNPGPVVSLTRELTLDYENGLLKVDTPRAQAVAGFHSKAGPIQLTDVTIDCSNEYAVIAVMSLDNQPIATSKKLLIQATTEEQPLGFRVEGNTIAELGGAPLGVRRIDARITLDNESKIKVHALDENGYSRAGTTTVEDREGGALIHLREDSLYHIIER